MHARRMRTIPLWLIGGVLLLAGCDIGASPASDRPTVSAPTTAPVTLRPASTPSAPSSVPTLAATRPAPSTPTSDQSPPAPTEPPAPTVPQPASNSDAVVVGMVPNPVLPVNLAEQLAFAPSQGAGGNTADCMENGRMPAGVSTLRVSEDSIDIAGQVALCYIGFDGGAVNEQVLGPSGELVRSLEFTIDKLLDASDFTALPGDRPGRYTVVAKMSQGEFRAAFEVTDHVAFKPQGERSVVPIGRGNSKYVHTIQDTAYLFASGFAPEERLDLYFYEACRITGHRRGIALGRNYVIGGRARVNREGWAFIRIPDDIAGALRSAAKYNVLARSEQGPAPTPIAFEEHNGEILGWIFDLANPLDRELNRERAAFTGSHFDLSMDTNGNVRNEDLPVCPAPGTIAAAPLTAAPEVRATVNVSVVSGSDLELSHYFAAAGGMIYIAGQNELLAIDSSRGTIQWRVTTNWRPSSLPPLLDGDALYLVAWGDPPGARLFAFNRLTGQLYRQTPLPETGELLAAFILDGAIYLGDDHGRLTAVDAATGRIRWSVETGDAISTLFDADGALYAATRNGQLYTLNRDTGTVEHLVQSPVKWNSWLVSLGTLFTAAWKPALAVAQNVAYIGGEDRQLYAVDVQTGENRWVVPIETGVSATPAIADGSVYVGSYAGYLYALDAATGQERWRFPVGDWVNTPVVADGVVYVSGENNHLFAVDAQTGQELWQYASEGTIWTDPQIDNGMVYLLSRISVRGKSSLLLHALSSARMIAQYPPASQPTSTRPDSGQTPVPQTPSSVTASSFAPSALDSIGNTITYEPANVADGRRETAWRVEGDGVGQFVQLDFARPVRVAEIRLLPGYAKIDPYDGTDRFAQNRRVRRARFEFSDGSSVEASFDDVADLQSIPIGPLVTSFVRVVILETIAPASDDPLDFTPISEVVVLGVSR
jgi:outer membrane protein assembly factor BamB